MNTYSKKNRKNNNKTLKKQKNLNAVDIRYYSSNFKNTNNLPRTQILNYLLKHYRDFLNHKKLCETLNTEALTFEDCFLTNPEDFHNGLKSDNIDLTLQMNPKTNLDKLIAYCFYLKQPEFFTYNVNKTIESIKFQIGKDIVRDLRTINTKLYSQDYYTDNANDNYKVTDLFYQNIIDYLYQVNKKIDLNIVNKFGLLSAQNVYGLISDLVTYKLFKVLEPEFSYLNAAEKHVVITINPNNISMEFHFSCKLLITRNNQSVEIEYPCGNMEFVFLVDILNNKYEMSKFILNYDIDKCGPEIEINESDNLENKNENKKKLKTEVVVPAVALSSGIIATPFLLSVFGGKHKKTLKKRRKNK